MEIFMDGPFGSCRNRLSTDCFSLMQLLEYRQSEDEENGEAAISRRVLPVDFRSSGSLPGLLSIR
jgi:hypothetical protein